MSIFKTNKFFRVVKHFILAIPLMFVLGVSLYTIVNPNAKDSYYGDTINDVLETPLDSLQDIKRTQEYYYYNDVMPILSEGVTSRVFNIFVDDFEWIYTNSPLTRNDIVSVSFNYYSTNNTYVPFFRVDYVNGETNAYRLSDYVFNFKCIIQSTNINYVAWADNFNYFYQVTHSSYSYLSNAFEYGMYQFTQVGFGQIDFVSFFNGIFMTNINNVYATFINDYINYYLFVECVYFAPWVLHAFIHFIYDMADLFRGRFNKSKEDD